MIDVPAPVVASVWQLHVAVGDRVVAGQTLAVLESMKMEIPVYAPADAVVAELPAALGVIVQEGDAVVRLSAD